MANITSNWTGWWLVSDTASWDWWVIPTEWDWVIIQSGDIITIDDEYIWWNDSSSAITVNWTIKASRSINNKLTCKWELIINGSLDYWTSSDKIPVDINAIILTNYSNSLSSWKYWITCNTEASYFLFGAEKTGYTTLTADIGDNSLTVVDATWWLVGDILWLWAVGDWHSHWSKNDTVTITSINGTTIWFSWTVSNSHLENSYVCNVTRNVQINSYNTSYVWYTNLIHNESTPSRELQNASFHKMGSTNSPLHYGAIRIDWKGKNAQPYINIKWLAFYETDNYCIDLYNCIKRLTIDDCILYWWAKHRNWMYTRAGSVATFNNCFFAAHNTWHVSSRSQGWVGIILNDCYFIGCWYWFIHSSANWFIYNRVVFGSCYKCLNFSWWATSYFNYCTFWFTNGSYIATTYYGVITWTNTLTVPYLNKCTFNSSNKDIYVSSVVNDWFKIYLLDKNEDTKAQEEYNKFGSLIRDVSVFDTSVASIKFTPSVSDSPLKYEIQQLVNVNNSLTVTVQARKNSNYNGLTNPLIRIKWNSFNITKEMSDTNNAFELISITTDNLVSTEVLTISIEAIGTSWNAWFDDLHIKWDVYDIWQNLFAGGTEISNVVDITDTSKNVTLTWFISGSDIVILEAGTENALVNIDQETNETYTFINPDTITIDIWIIKPWYVTQYIYWYTVNTKWTTLPITQIVDRNYKN